MRLCCQSYFAPRRVVSETDFVLTMPQSHARILNAPFGNRLVPFPLKVPAFDAYLCWRANAEGDPASAWLRQRLTNAYANIAGVTSAPWRSKQQADERSKIQWHHRRA